MAKFFSSKYVFFYMLRTHFCFGILMCLETLINILTNMGLYCRKRARLPDSLKGKTVVITGANAGIGKECAKRCLRLGAKVIIACRDETKAKSAMEEIVEEAGAEKRVNLTFVELDLASLDSVRLAAKVINQMTTQIDVLLNNAGVMASPEWKTKDGYEYQFGVNHLGHFLLTNLLIEKLKASPSSRIVNLSSIAHVIGLINFENVNLNGEYSPMKAYAQSKLANVLFTVELHKRLLESSVNVYSVHPGIVNTQLIRHFSNFVLKIVARYLNFSGLSPELGAQTSLHCAFSEETANQSGFYYANCTQVNSMYPHAIDEEDASRLWDVSLKMVNLIDEQCNLKNIVVTKT